MPGYKDWIDAIDIKVDYFSAFMKAWIAFNAWYNFSGEVTGNSDKECIEYIAKQNNQTTTSNFPCNFNFTVSNMNRFN